MKNETIIELISHHYGKRLRRYLRSHYPKLENRICREYPVRFAKYMAESDMGENNGRFVSYLNIFSGLAAYELLRENDVSQAGGIAAYDEMCKVMRKLGQTLYHMADLLPNGYQLVVNSLLEDITGPKAVCWDTEILENSSKAFTYKIHRCLYYDTCKAHGYPEFTQVFCTHDWYSLGVLRHHAKFVRYSTIAEGGCCCHDSIQSVQHSRGGGRK